MIYCIESWGNAAACHIYPLIILQKRIVRLITFSNYDASSDAIFKDLYILPLQKLVYNRIGIMMYKYVNGLLPQVMNELYTCNSDIHEHFTRQRHLLHTSRSKTNVFMNSFTNVSPRIWNALQKKINVNVSISIFKRSLKSFLQFHTLEVIYPK